MSSVLKMFSKWNVFRVEEVAGCFDFLCWVTWTEMQVTHIECGNLAC